MRFNEIKEYFKINFDIPALWNMARNKIADRIKNEEDFLEEFIEMIPNFKNADTMLDKMTKDAFDADIEDKEELEMFPNEWLSWITRL